MTTHWRDLATCSPIKVTTQLTTPREAALPKTTPFPRVIVKAKGKRKSMVRGLLWVMILNRKSMILTIGSTKIADSIVIILKKLLTRNNYFEFINSKVLFFLFLRFWGFGVLGTDYYKQIGNSNVILNKTLIFIKFIFYKLKKKHVQKKSKGRTDLKNA